MYTKKIILFLISTLIGVCLFYWVIKWVGWQEIKEILFTFSGYKGAAILALTISIWLSGFWKWNFILRSQGCRFPLISLGEIFFSSKTITYLFTPTVLFGGEAFRVYAVKKKFDFPWEKNIAVIAIEKILGISTLLIFLILGIFSFFILSEMPFENFGLIAVLVIAFLILILSIFYSRSFKEESIIKYFLIFFTIKKAKNRERMRDVEKEIFNFFDFRKTAMWKGLGIAFLRYFLILARCWLIVFFLKGEINLLIPFVVFFFLYLSFVLPIPTGLGSSEATQAFAFGALGLGSATGIIFSFVIRGAETMVALFGLFLLIRMGIKFFVKYIQKS